jgi:hypothetical protein
MLVIVSSETREIQVTYTTPSSSQEGFHWLEDHEKRGEEAECERQC